MLGAVGLVGAVGVHQGVGRSPDQPAAAGSTRSGADPSRVPEDFRAACGRPGAVVHLRTVPRELRIDERDCDLAGVHVHPPAGETGGIDMVSLVVDGDEAGRSVFRLGPVTHLGNQ